MVEIVHLETGDKGRCPAAALAHQRTLGWVTAAEADNKPAKTKPAPAGDAA